MLPPPLRPGRRKTPCSGWRGLELLHGGGATACLTTPTSPMPLPLEKGPPQRGDTTWPTNTSLTRPSVEGSLQRAASKCGRSSTLSCLWGHFPAGIMTDALKKEWEVGAAEGCGGRTGDISGMQSFLLNSSRIWCIVHVSSHHQLRTWTRLCTRAPLHQHAPWHG